MILASIHPRLRLLTGLAVLVATLFMVVACGSGDDKKDSSGSKSTPAASTGAAAVSDGKTVAGYPTCAPGGASAFTGAGATFPFPLYSKWVSEYEKLCSVKINYQSVGSGAGIQQITAKTVDFGGSDGVMTEAQEKDAAAAGGPILHIPMTSGAEAVVFNLPGINRGQIKLTPDVLADIYLKKVTKWNDQRITALNAGVNLPNSDITVVHRSDGSGTTFIFTNYLSKVSPEWADKVKFGTSVNWPGDVGGQGNEGVAGQVKQLPGSIGYVELAYAKQNNLSWVQLKNKAGNYVEPSLGGATKAADGVTLPDDMKYMLTDSPNAQAYPITGYTWVLAYVNAQDVAKGKALAHYLWWAVHDGQKFAEALDYAPHSPDSIKKAEAQILSLKCGTAACLTK